MDFKEKSIDEMGSWLRKDLGFGDKIVDIFKGIALHALHSSSLVIRQLVEYLWVLLSENDVDGETFLLLEDADIISLVPSIGARRKLISKRKSINDSCSKVNMGINTCQARAKALGYSN